MEKKTKQKTGKIGNWWDLNIIKKIILKVCLYV